MRRPVALLLVLLCACSSAPALGPVSQSPSPSVSGSSAGPSPSPSPSATSEPADEPWVPEPGSWIPRKPRRLAAALERIEAEVLAGVDAWLAQGDPDTERSPRSLVLQVLYQQRIFRLLVRRPALADRVFDNLEGRLLRMSRSLVQAGAGLRSLTTPVDPSHRFKTGRARPPGELWRFFRKAQRRFDVHPEVLAAVNMVETRFNRVRSTSSAGAQGPMQFLPSTWDAYGMGGDIYDPHDAILGAANYLSASGAPQDYPGALYAYNHADEYVDAVLAYARWIGQDRRRYFVFYNWQAFAVTTEGDRQLTGPGS